MKEVFYMFIDDKRDELIQIRVTSKQKSIIKQLAKDNKLTLTKYVLSLIESDYKKKSIK